MKHGDVRPGRPDGERPPADPFVRRDTFLGFPLSTTVASGLADVMRRVDAAGDEAQLRWVAPPHLHVNVRHLGPMFPEHLVYVTEQLAAALATTERFPVHLGEFALWPRPSVPRALWVRLVDDEGGLAGLRRVLDEALTGSDLTVPEHPFEPHVTLALPQALSDPEGLLERLATARGSAVGRFWVTHLELTVAPADGGAGRPYEPYTRIALQPRAGRGGAGGVAGEEGADEAAAGRATVRYIQPTLPAPSVEGGGRPTLPGERRLRRFIEGFDEVKGESGGDAEPAEYAEPAEPPDAETVETVESVENVENVENMADGADGADEPPGETDR